MRGSCGSTSPRAGGAGRGRRVDRGGSRRRFQAGDSVLADAELLRDADLPLASGKVRYVGEAVVAVVATSRYLAEDALELIEVDYEPLGAVARAELAVAADAPLLHEEAGTNVLIAREFKKGDVAADLKAAQSGSAAASR